jgi:hypothetical protein
VRRARLLIYDGDEAWIELTKAREFVKPEAPYSCAGGTIRSVELDEAEITLFECPDSPVRVRAQGKVTSCE